MDKAKFDQTDKHELKQRAEILRELLDAYARTDRSAKQCRKILGPLLKKAEGMILNKPVDEVPCGYTFHEGELRQYPELESAYAKFCVSAEGDDIEGAKQRMREHNSNFKFK